MPLPKDVKSDDHRASTSAATTTPARPRFRSHCSRSASATSPSTSRSTRRTTTPAVAFCKMVGQRRRLLNYLKKSDIERYRKVIAELGIRG